MKKTIIIVIAALISSGGNAFSQDLEKVLKNYFEASGQEKLLTTKNSKSSGKMIQMGLEIPFVQYAAKPSNFKIEASFQGMSIIQVYNGTEGWSINPFAGVTDPQPMSEDELKAMKSQADYEGQLWNWSDKGYTVTLEGNEDVEGTDCFKIKVVTPEKDEMVYFIDSENYIALKVANKVTVQGNTMESETYMSNYKEQDGMVYAGKIETRMNGQVASTIVIDTLEFDLDLGPDFFSKPTK